MSMPAGILFKKAAEIGVVLMADKAASIAAIAFAYYSYKKQYSLENK